MTDVALIEAVTAKVEACEIEGEGWNQFTYRCSTGMCWAGWLGELTGVEWAANLDTGNESMIVAPVNFTGDTYTVREVDVEKGSFSVPAGTLVTPVACYAEWKMGRSRTVWINDFPHDLFNGSNGIQEIRKITKAMVAEAQGG